MESGGGMAAGGSGPTGSAEFHLADYRLGKTLGMGAFGKVKLAEHVLAKLKVAIKILNRNKIRETEMEEKVEREIQILRLFMDKDHPHIVRLYEVIETPTDIFLVMEYMKSGDLFDHIVENGRLQEEEARRFFQQIISGVEYCHRNRVVHRDLKPDNLLLDHSKLNVKITDFGLSNTIRDGHFLRTCCGTPNYAAPEVISAQMYAGPEVDVWSCGVILYALLCGVLPFDDENLANLYDKIKRGIYTLPSHLSRGSRDLISRMLVVDPTERVTIPEIRQHPWFQATLPRYLAVPPDTHQQPKRIDEDVLQVVNNIGFHKNRVIESLWNGVQNQATVAYYLLLDNRRRISHEFQERRRKEVAQVVHMDHMTVQTPIGRPSTSVLGSFNHCHGSSPSGLNQHRFHAERKWALGLHSKDSPRELMMEVLNALHGLEISWMKLGSFCLKCRWVPPVAASRARRSNSDSPMVSGSPGYPNSSMLSGLSYQQGVDPHRTSATTAVNVDSHDISSHTGEEHSAVEFEVQLYTVREEKYMVDLQRLEGPHLLFLDLCASFFKELRIF